MKLWRDMSSRRKKLLLIFVLLGSGCVAFVLLVAFLAVASMGLSVNSEPITPELAELECPEERWWDPACWQTPGSKGRTVAPGLETVGWIVSSYDREDSREILADAASVYGWILRATRFVLPGYEGRARGDHFLAGLHFMMGDIAAAEELYLRALRTAEENGLNALDAAALSNNVGLFYMWTDRYGEAELHLRRSVDLVPEDDVHAAIAMQNLGAVYARLGDSEQADRWLEQAWDEVERNPGLRHSQRATIRSNLATLWQTLGDTDRAAAAYRVLLDEGRMSSAVRAPALNGLAEIHRQHREHDLARELYLEALDLPVGSSMRAVLLVNLGVLAWEQDRLDDADRYLYEGLDLVRQIEEDTSPGVGVVLLNVAWVELARDRPDAALELLAEARSRLEPHLPADHPALYSALQMAALAELRRGDRDAALVRAQEAQGLFEERLRQILSFGTERQRLAYYARSTLYDLLAHFGEATPLAEAVLRTKGAVSNSILDERAVLGALADGEATRARLRTLRWQRMQATAAAGTSAEADERLEDLERQIKREWREVLKRVGRNEEERLPEIALAEVREKLGPSGVLVEFIHYQRFLRRGTNGESRDMHRLEPSYGAVVVPARGTPKWIPLGPAGPVDEQVAAVQSAMRTCSEAWVRDVRLVDEACADVEGRLESALRGLYRDVWRPVEEALPPRAAPIVIGPDARLNLLPFGALLRDDGGFVIDGAPIVYVASGRDLLGAGEAAPDFPSSLTVYAIPLSSAPAGEIASDGAQRLPSATLREARALEERAAAHGWTVTTHVGADATEARLRERSPSGVLHMATHGSFWEEEELEGLPWVLRDPMLRGLVVLSGYRATLGRWRSDGVRPTPDDGILLAEEIAMLDLDETWLTVLSACDTGFGETLPGEGVLGLRRGFHLAGNRRLLLTLWPIYDDARTVAFIDDFYEELMTEHDAVTAWQRVKKRHLRRLREDDSLGTALKVAGGFVLTTRGQPVP